MCTFMYTHINMNLVWCGCMCACGCVCVCRWAPLCVDLWRPEKDISVHSLSSHYSLMTSSLAGPRAPSSCAMWAARCHGVPPPAGTWATGVWDCAGRLKSSRSGDSCPPSHPSALEYFKLVSHPMKTKIEARSFCTSIQALGWSSQVFKSEVKHEAGRYGGQTSELYFCLRVPPTPPCGHTGSILSAVFTVADILLCSWNVFFMKSVFAVNEIQGSQQLLRGWIFPSFSDTLAECWLQQWWRHTVRVNTLNYVEDGCAKF